jgi:hypothetical protein
MAGRKKIGRNDPCPCGSGRKYKNCCADKAGRISPVGWIAIAAAVLAVGVLGTLLLRMARGGGGTALSPTCPPGQVWSPEHGHCHEPQAPR